MSLQNIYFEILLQDLHDKFIPVLAEATVDLMLVFRIATWNFPEGLTADSYSDAFKTILGHTQAPRGHWHPSMAWQGLIPHLDDVIAALDASVSKDIRDL